MDGRARCSSLAFAHAAHPLFLFSAAADALESALRESGAETGKLRQRAAKLSEATLKAFQAAAKKQASSKGGA